jgi:hypothetical protein
MMPRWRQLENHGLTRSTTFMFLTWWRFDLLRDKLSVDHLNKEVVAWFKIATSRHHRQIGHDDVSFTTAGNTDVLQPAK